MGAANLPPVSYCQLNMSQCDASENNDQFVVNVYNSLARNINKYIRVPITNRILSYKVLDPQGNHNHSKNFRTILDSNFFYFFKWTTAGQEIPSQTIPIASFVRSLPGRESGATRELVFLASQLPPLGSKSYFIQPALTNFATHSKMAPRTDDSISNEVRFQIFNLIIPVY